MFLLQRLSDITHHNTHKLIKEEHADNEGIGINNEIRGVMGLWVGGEITAASRKLTNTILTNSE